MLAFENSGFSIDGSVRIALVNRDVPSFYRSLEYLMRSCARPASALGRLSLEPGRDGGPDRIRYTLPRHKRGQWLGPGRRRRASAPDAEDVIRLSPLEFLDRLADVIPPPHRHRHRYHCVFAPNHPLSPVTALAIGKLGKRGDAASQHESSLPLHRGEGRGEGAFDARPCSHDTARIAWAQLIARIAEAFPLVCAGCGKDIRFIAFITEPTPIREIITHLGEPLEPPPLAPARGPPTDWGDFYEAHDKRDVYQATDSPAARDRHPQPLNPSGPEASTSPPWGGRESLRADARNPPL